MVGTGDRWRQYLDTESRFVTRPCMPVKVRPLVPTIIATGS